jgi:hypothetical protein
MLGVALLGGAGCTSAGDGQRAQPSANDSVSASPGAASSAVASNGDHLLDPARAAQTTRLIQQFAPSAADRWFFAYVRDVAVDAKGRVYVLDDDQVIRVFEPDGSLLRSMGRLGSGPGEFRRARWLRVLGDTLWVHDPMNARLTAFHTEDGTLRENSRPGATPMRLDDISPVGHYETSPSHDDRPSTLNPLVVTVLHAQRAGGESRALMRFSKSRAVLSFPVYAFGETRAASSRLGQMNARQPFDNEPLWRVGHGGRALSMLLRDEGAATGAMNPFGVNRSTQSMRLVAIGFGGDTLLDRTLMSPAVPVTDAHVRAIVDSMAYPPEYMKIQGKRIAADPAEVRDSLYVPRVWPAVTEFFVGDDGTYWLRQPQPPSPVARFWRLAPDGTQLPAVEVPAGLTIHRVRADRLWVAREDESGTPVVELHEVVASRAK